MHDPSSAHPNMPIGVFDSGIGGLTVLHALQRAMPQEDFVYLGDTARLPYGTKSADTVRRYACNMARHLMQHNVKALVVACNTASSCAMDDIKAIAGDVPVIGMVEPAAAATLSAVSPRAHVLVLGTRATISSQCYTQALKAQHNDLQVTGQPCQLLVALAEEGWHDDVISDATIRQYLAQAGFQDGTRDSGQATAQGARTSYTALAAPPDAVILGCTHFPVFHQALLGYLGPDCTIINCGEAAAQQLLQSNMPRHTPRHALQHTGNGGTCSFKVTDAPDYFREIAPCFLGHPLTGMPVDMVDISA